MRFKGDHQGGRRCDGVERGRAATEQMRRGEDDGHPHGALDRWIGTDQRPIGERGQDRYEGGGSSPQRPRERGHHDGGEQSEVAAGDHDQVRQRCVVEVGAQLRIDGVAATGDHSLCDARQRRRQGGSQAAIERLSSVGGEGLRPADLGAAKRLDASSAGQSAGGDALVGEPLEILVLWIGR